MKDKKENEVSVKMPDKIPKGLVSTLITVAIIIFLLFTSFFIVNAGERGILITLGNPSDAVITEGIHLKIPLIQQVVKMDIKTQKDEVDANSASKDLQTVNAKIAVNYHLESNSAPRIYKEVGIDYVSRILSPAIQESTKAATAQYTAEELITKREFVRETIKELLISKMSVRGIVVEDVLITNFDFSASFNSAIEAKVTAEQNALKELNQLKAVEYQAQQRITQAKGEAEAIKIQAEAITQQGGEQYVQLQAISKWNGEMPMVTGGALPFIYLNTSQ